MTYFAFMHQGMNQGGVKWWRGGGGGKEGVVSQGFCHIWLTSLCCSLSSNLRLTEYGAIFNFYSHSGPEKPVLKAL